MTRSPNPTGRRIVQPDMAVQNKAPETWNYLVQLVRDLELNFLDTQEVEVATQTIVTSVNNSITVIQGDISNVSAALVSNVSVLTAADTAILSSVSTLDTRITSVNDRISTVSTVLNARITSVADNAGFSGLILRNGAGALITQSSVILRLQDSRDL